MSVEKIRTVDIKGPWQSKSGGNLSVIFALSQMELTDFLDINNPEFQKVEDKTGKNIRGLRSYTVTDIPKGAIGGMEYHKARTEYIGACVGKAVLECTDFNGEEKEFILDDTLGVFIPPNVIHTYTSLEDGTSLQVVCNTLFDPSDPRTHDTYRMV